MAAIEPPKPAVREPQTWPLGVKAYHTLGEMGLIPERTELLYGQIYHKMPKSPFHTYLLQFLAEILRTALEPGFILRIEQPLTCADSEPEPDLSVVRGDIADFRHAHPQTAELAIEICVSSHDYDRFKLRAYAAAGVKECWMVLGPEQQIEIHRQPCGDRFTEQSVHGPGGSLSSTVLPSFTVELSSLFGKD